MSILCAPAIVRASSLMPIKAMTPEYDIVAARLAQSAAIEDVARMQTDSIMLAIIRRAQPHMDRQAIMETFGIAIATAPEIEIELRLR